MVDMAGYSDKTLRDKLGLKMGQRSAIVRLPEAVSDDLGNIADLNTLTRVVGVPFDFILMFITSREQLEAVLPNLVRHLHSGGMLWLAWTKRTSPLHHGLNDAIIRDLGLKSGLIDVKVMSVSNDWSGLKFVHPQSNRK
jgi:hypothetical protein